MGADEETCPLTNGFVVDIRDDDGDSGRQQDNKRPSPSVGYLGNGFLPPPSPFDADSTQPLQSATVGRQSCPWLIEARPGQRVRLRLVVLGIPHVDGAGDADTRHQLGVVETVCPRIVVRDGEDDDDGGDDGGRVQERYEFDACVRGDQRDRDLVTSGGHRLTVYIVTKATTASAQGNDDDDEISVEMRQSQQQQQQQAATTAVVETRFMLYYEGTSKHERTNVHCLINVVKYAIRFDFRLPYRCCDLCSKNDAL